MPLTQQKYPKKIIFSKTRSKFINRKLPCFRIPQQLRRSVLVWRQHHRHPARSTLEKEKKYRPVHSLRMTNIRPMKVVCDWSVKTQHPRSKVITEFTLFRSTGTHELKTQLKRLHKESLTTSWDVFLCVCVFFLTRSRACTWLRSYHNA